MCPDDKVGLVDALRQLGEVSKVAAPDSERAEVARREHEKAMVDAAIDWLREMWGPEKNSAPCPYCGHDAYSVGPPIESHPFGRPNVLKAYIPVTCMKCAQTVFLDAERSTGFPIPDGAETAPEEPD